MRKKNAIRLCDVCGDQAIGRHFGALTCKSCKPFFRRNALKENTLKCKSNGNCVVNRETRKSCRKCRLDKCLAVGMNKNNIQNETEKQIRKQMIETNKLKKDNQNVIHNECQTNTCLMPYKPIDNREESSDQLSDQLSDESDNLYQQMCVNKRKPKDLLTQVLEINEIIDEEIGSEIITTKTYLVNNERTEGWRQKVVNLMDMSTKPVAINNVFTHLESINLLEVISSCKVYQNFMLTPFNIKNRGHVCNFALMYSIMDSFYTREIQNVITLSKKLSTFQDLCEDDKIALIKYGFSDILCLRSVAYYDRPNEFWTLIMDNGNSFIVKLDILKSMRTELYNTYKTNLHNVCGEWDSDPVILDMLTAIALFNPTRPNLIKRDVIKLQQNIYLYLLQRYLVYKYGGESGGKIKFLRLLNTLEDIYTMGQIQLKNNSDENANNFSPLVREMYDMKPK
ncbi:unnamed protein product [Medioppia subpectinata]|uniref:Uncharacterized protein n=1 Tax=Medioppia subpectinata TaxID=1979941 RepID=A0A7R9KB94_9ACAR|nr:unnamed protein product [Medioppia subpectinata]CAG2100000.1 unnamed protein product [Medioppia subpectinata]